MNKRKTVIAMVTFGTALITGNIASAQTAPSGGQGNAQQQGTTGDDTSGKPAGSTTPDNTSIPNGATSNPGTTATNPGQDQTTPAMTSPNDNRNYGENNDRSGGGFLRSYGLSLSVGAGVIGFTDSTMRDTTKTGGLWDVRVGLMTNRALGLELAYEGGLQAIDALGLDTDAQLLSTEVEALARVNFLTGRWIVQPYAFAGAAWKRYSLENVETNTSDVNDSDDVLEIPLGIGLGYRVSGFLVDVRGSFRPAVDSDLLPENNQSGDSAALHAWAATLRLGYAF
jgi:hypothetical protein